MSDRSVTRHRRFAAPGLLLLAVLTVSLLFSACGQSYRNDLTAQDVANSVLSALPAGEGRHVAGQGYVSASSFGEKYTDLREKTDGYVIYLSDASDTNIDEIGVFHVVESGDVSGLKKILEEYVKAQQLRLKDLLESYNPDELPKLDNAQVTVCGNYILYTILSDSDTATAKEAFAKALKAATE